MSPEKRKSPRANIICKISLIFGERLLMLDSYTQNISSGGVRAVFAEKLHVSTPIALELFISGENALKCCGEVIWIKEVIPTTVGPSLVDTGIRFTGIDRLNQEAIDSRVNIAILQEQSYKN